MEFGLRGRKAIVTGGSRGIGKAIALELAREGVDVAIVARGQEKLTATARELAAETGQRIVPIVTDVTSREQVDRMTAQAAEQLGGLHILVNSGALPGGSPTAVGRIGTVVDEDLLQDFNVKYLGALRCCRAALPHMKAAGWGRIINISGTNARTAGNLSGGARNTSLVHLTRTLALQFGRDGITPAEAEAREFAENAPRANAIGRMVDASEIACLTVFLASDKAWAVTGELIVANGGTGAAVYY